MDLIYLFPDPGPPVINPETEVPVNVPCARRAVLYRAELVDTYFVFKDLAGKYPRMLKVFFDGKLFSALAKMLDDCVSAGVVADVNHFMPWTQGGEDAATRYERYLAACLRDGKAPAADAQPEGWSVSGTLTSIVRWVFAREDEPKGVGPFYARHPHLRRMVDTIVGNFQANVARAAKRIDADWDDLEKFFFENHKLYELVRMKSSGSDFHKGGQQVLILTFRGTPKTPPSTTTGFVANVTRGVTSALNYFKSEELRLIYKPSDLERDARIVGDTQHLLGVYGSLGVGHIVAGSRDIHADANAGKPSLFELLNTKMAGVMRGENNALAVYRILPCFPGSQGHGLREAYGYVEFLPYEPTFVGTQDGGLPDFYYQWGVITAAAFVFGITDLHHGNVIVRGQRPHVIDLEMAYFGLMKSLADTTLNSAVFESGEDDQTRFVKPKKKFGAPGDELVHDIGGGSEPTLNLPVPGGKYTGTTPSAYNAFMAGFDDAMDCLKTHAPDFATWLAGMEQTVVRVIPYPTGTLLAALRNFHAWCALEELSGGADASRYIANRRREEEEAWIENVKFWNRTIKTNAWYPHKKLKDRAFANRVLRHLAIREAVPCFCVWDTGHILVDFMNGDIPAYYQKLGSTTLLGSSGASVPVRHGASLDEKETFDITFGFESWKDFLPWDGYSAIVWRLDRLAKDDAFFALLKGWAVATWPRPG